MYECATVTFYIMSIVVLSFSVVSVQEWLALRVGYTSRELCHHCRVTNSAFMVVPSVLDKVPRRNIPEVVARCTKTGLKSPSDAK